MKLLTKVLIGCGVGIVTAIVGDLAFDSTFVHVLGWLICGASIGYAIANRTKLSEPK
jgi:NAD/NADP transhydrogenase beta subunit